MCFVKIKKSMPTIEFETGTVFAEYGSKNDGIFKGIQYSHTTGKFDEFYNLIPTRYREQFSYPSLMSITSNVPPHTDSAILSSINFYIQPSFCVTIFYNFKENTDIIANQTNGSLFDRLCLDEVGSFIAEQNDVWLLDVTKPHSVTSLLPNVEFRSALVLQTKHFTFDQVQEMLAEQNFL
jgi:hypothetical protein